MKRKIDIHDVFATISGCIIIGLVLFCLIYGLIEVLTSSCWHDTQSRNFCVHCGQAFAQQCPSCHEWCKTDITYCPECGYLLEE